jgi:hypothetical protein
MFLQHGSHQPAALPLLAESDEPTGGDSDNTLEDAARDEREYVRERLRRELQRDPTEDEVNDWLRQHTEGY